MTMLDTVKITPELIAAHGITPDEYQKIVKTLGREPNITELGMYSVMWSEHCSYKNTKPVLKTFPTSGPRLLVRAGEENAGIVDIGNGLAICFKIESHNHPSAIEPFQGAATGVGGILRDIFTMGARPVLLLNSLRFGRFDSKVTQHLFKGVVHGISHYGNCMGIPTVGGEIYFHECYDGNPLVNVMALGIMEAGKIVKGKATGEGNPVYYVGATTGRDGLGGAAFASRDLTEKSKEDRPAVQVGDPFMEKLLMEACLELAKTDAIVGMQDMGAAGLTCSTSETAARASMGIEIDLALVPKREEGMTPYEIMLSESQERMLIIVKKGKEKIVEDIFKKWDLHAVKIGEVKSGNRMRVFDNGELVSDVPAKSLVDEGPIYTREEKRPAYLDKTEKLNLSQIKDPSDYKAVLKKLLGHPSIASKRWVWEQYDHMVRTDTVFYPGHDAGLVRVKGTNKGIAVTTDCNSIYCYLDPYEGGKIAVAESARNVVCTGAQPLAVTDNLNFGNPHNPEIFWQLRQAANGISEACIAFKTPVTGGNVSLYNQNPSGAIYPTPTIGMVGLLDDIEKRVPSHFQQDGDIVFLIGKTRNEIGGSHYLMVEHGLVQGIPPRLELAVESALHAFILEAAQNRELKSCHDLSEGGLAVALAESCFGFKKALGVNIDHLDLMPKDPDLRPDALYFGETQSRVIISADPKDKEAVIKRAQSHGVPIYQIGKVSSGKFEIGDKISCPIEELKNIFESAISSRIGIELADN